MLAVFRRIRVPQVDVPDHRVFQEGRRGRILEAVVARALGHAAINFSRSLLDPGHVDVVGEVQHQHPRPQLADLVVVRHQPGSELVWLTRLGHTVESSG